MVKIHIREKQTYNIREINQRHKITRAGQYTPVEISGMKGNTTLLELSN